MLLQSVVPSFVFRLNLHTILRQLAFKLLKGSSLYDKWAAFSIPHPDSINFTIVRVASTIILSSDSHLIAVKRRVLIYSTVPALYSIMVIFLSKAEDFFSSEKQ